MTMHRYEARIICTVCSTENVFALFSLNPHKQTFTFADEIGRKRLQCGHENDLHGLPVKSLAKGPH